MSALTAADVMAGDALPELVVGVTSRTVIMGASASRDWQPQHHDHAWAVEKVGPRGIFLNTPNQAGWIERYVTQWAGAAARLGRMRFRMRRTVCPGDELRFNATVTAVGDDGWLDLDITLTVGGETVTTCTARVCVPRDPTDNPWSRRGDDWRP
jgi:acyl dehydratase